MSDALAHSTLTFAETTSAVNGTGKGGGSGTGGFDMKGHRAVK